MNASKKLGLNTASYMETEISSNGERFPNYAWLHCFRLAQGSTSKEHMVMQDNKSCVLMLKNYTISIGKCSKYIHIRYFFAVDKMMKNKERVVHFPTDKMMSDYNTKPTQGSFFAF